MDVLLITPRGHGFYPGTVVAQGDMIEVCRPNSPVYGARYDIIIDMADVDAELWNELFACRLKPDGVVIGRGDAVQRDPQGA